MKLLRPLYRIPEGIFHWYLTYLDHHLKFLHMKKSKSGQFLLIRHNDNELSGLVILQVEDSFSMGIRTFMMEKEEASKSFISKDLILLLGSPTSFNGILITRKHDGEITIKQPSKIHKLTQQIDLKNFVIHHALV